MLHVESTVGAAVVVFLLAGMLGTSGPIWRAEGLKLADNNMLRTCMKWTWTLTLLHVRPRPARMAARVMYQRNVWTSWHGANAVWMLALRRRNDL